jgi:hypothetical protein
MANFLEKFQANNRALRQEMIDEEGSLLITVKGMKLLRD